eukprot:m.2692 g.2692  ORF g.2692 m.2692 type:complete len:79 (-) comp3056_c0_seq2:31-267(-)
MRNLPSLFSRSGTWARKFIAGRSVLVIFLLLKELFNLIPLSEILNPTLCLTLLIWCSITFTAGGSTFTATNTLSPPSA